MIKRRGRNKKKRKLKSSVKASMRRSSKKNKRGYDKSYLMVRNEVLQRDHWTCQLCDAAGIRLEVHHITLYSKSKRLRKNKRNLIALCKTCHSKIRNKEERYKPILRAKVSRNTLRHKTNKKSREEIIAELKKKQKLPEGFEEYVYSTNKDVKRVRVKEHYLRKTWRDIKYRTSNKTCASYPRYGGRGIEMCDEWFDSFPKFKEYVDVHLGERPRGYSIDRIDNDGHYEPGNIRWESAKVQKQNNSQTILDEGQVLVAWILFHKYKMKQCDIMYKLSLNSGSLVSNIVNFKTWKNVTYKYHSLVKNKKIKELIEEFMSHENLL